MKKTYYTACIGLFLIFFGPCIMEKFPISGTVCFLFGIILMIPEYRKFKKEEGEI